jgi:hypothetical protein
MQTGKSKRYTQSPVCKSGTSILYAWARDAPDLTLPDGVGFKVGERPVFVPTLFVHKSSDRRQHACTISSFTSSLYAPDDGRP